MRKMTQYNKKKDGSDRKWVHYFFSFFPFTQKAKIKRICEIILERFDWSKKDSCFWTLKTKVHKVFYFLMAQRCSFCLTGKGLNTLWGENFLLGIIHILHKYIRVGRGFRKCQIFPTFYTGNMLTRVGRWFKKSQKRMLT